MPQYDIEKYSPSVNPVGSFGWDKAIPRGVGGVLAGSHYLPINQSGVWVDQTTTGPIYMTSSGTGGVYLKASDVK